MEESIFRCLGGQAGEDWMIVVSLFLWWTRRWSPRYFLPLLFRRYLEAVYKILTSIFFYSSYYFLWSNFHLFSLFLSPPFSPLVFPPSVFSYAFSFSFYLTLSPIAYILSSFCAGRQGDAAGPVRPSHLTVPFDLQHAAQFDSRRRSFNVSAVAVSANHDDNDEIDNNYFSVSQRQKNIMYHFGFIAIDFFFRGGEMTNWYERVFTIEQI